jgi:hypothetical protein
MVLERDITGQYWNDDRRFDTALRLSDEVAELKAEVNKQRAIRTEARTLYQIVKTNKVVSIVR